MTHSWQQALADVITDPGELLRELQIDPSWLPAAKKAATLFPLRVPRGFVTRMGIGDPHDPLLKQVLPLSEEFAEVPGFTKDPVNEQSANPVPGLLHKYPGRVLLTVTGACAVHCRYCFRRHFDYASNTPGRQGWESAMAYIQSDNSIEEVILSGGDPFVLNDAYLSNLIEKIAAIPHVKILRFHTRLPVVLPERITESLLDVLCSTHLNVVVVLHMNHANELDESVADGLNRLREKSIILLNQSVVLRGINDSVEALSELSKTLIRHGVVPYYLHLLDKIEGAAHFDVPEEEVKRLHQQLSARLPGYLVPRLVREEPGLPSKRLM